MFGRNWFVLLLTMLALFGIGVTKIQGQQQRPPADAGPQRPPANQPANQPPMKAELALPKQPAPPLKAPFVLTAEEQKALDALLDKWEQSSKAVRTFKCDFIRYEYDSTYGAKQENFLRSEGKGTLLFKRPDWGKFEIAELYEYDANAKPVPNVKGALAKMPLKPDARECWVCDGMSIYQFDYSNKKVVETKLPKELQGAALADGPIPFVFGTKAEQIRKRYFLKDITDAQAKKDGQIWLEAWPRSRADAANYKYVQVILTARDFMPFAVQVYLPGDMKKAPKKTVYAFSDINSNSRLADFLRQFATPGVPFGWKKEVQKTPADDTQRPAGDSAEARRTIIQPRK